MSGSSYYDKYKTDFSHLTDCILVDYKVNPVSDGWHQDDEVVFDILRDHPGGVILQERFVVRNDTMLGDMELSYAPVAYEANLLLGKWVEAVLVDEDYEEDKNGDTVMVTTLTIKTTCGVAEFIWRSGPNEKLSIYEGGER